MLVIAKCILVQQAPKMQVLILLFDYYLFNVTYIAALNDEVDN